jgi:hypothetical protein
MKKSEMAQKIWFSRTKRSGVQIEIDRIISMTKVERIIKIIKYYFYLVMFKLALLEFYVNLNAGKFFILCFNLVNKHKIRVNNLVQSSADKIRELQ